MKFFVYQFGLFCLAVFCWVRSDYFPGRFWLIVGWVFFALSLLSEPEVFSSKKEDKKS